MTQAVTVRNASMPARAGFDVEGFEDYDPRDLVLPAIKIVQLMTRGVEAGDMGKFLNTLTKQTHDVLDVVVLRRKKGRAYFASPGDAMPACSSDDAVAPRQPGIQVGNIIIPKMCRLCPFSAWGKDGKAPDCMEGFMLICAHVGTGKKFIFRVAGASLRPMREVFSAMIEGRIPQYGAAVHLATVFVEDKNGKYWVLKPALQAPFSPDEQAAWREQYIAMQDVAVTEDMPEGEAGPPQPEGNSEDNIENEEQDHLY